jgi:hypothetical protein
MAGVVPLEAVDTQTERFQFGVLGAAFGALFGDHRHRRDRFQYASAHVTTKKATTTITRPPFLRPS